MFEHYENDHRPKRSVWVRIAVSASVVAHVGVAAALIISAGWKLNKLNLEDRPVGISSFGLPAAAPPLAASKRTPIKKIDLDTTKEIAQVDDKPELKDVKTQDTQADVSSDAVDGEGDPDGIAGSLGTGKGLRFGSDSPLCLGPNCADIPVTKKPTVETPPAPKLIPQHLLKGSLLSGNTQIQPGNADAVAMARTGKAKHVGSLKTCISASGSVTSVKLIKSTGYPAYDRLLKSGVRRWRYKPYSVSGKAIPVCTVINFIYKQQ